MNPVSFLQLDPAVEQRDCEQCGVHKSVERSVGVRNFPYGAGDDAVTLKASVPVWTCHSCGEAYTDWEAEEVYHEAVCRHLDRPSPRELRAFREANRLSQDGFATLTRFGVASIKRWETGEQIPSASAAQHLQLVMMPGALKKLRARERSSRFLAPSPRFRTDIGDASKRDAQRFQLHGSSFAAHTDQHCLA